MEVLIQLISEVGFPIAMCIAMLWYINHTNKELTTAIENNTKVIEKLDRRIDELEDKIDVN